MTTPPPTKKPPGDAPENKGREGLTQIGQRADARAERLKLAHQRREAKLAVGGKVAKDQPAGASEPIQGGSGQPAGAAPQPAPGAQQPGMPTASRVVIVGGVAHEVQQPSMATEPTVSAAHLIQPDPDGTKNERLVNGNGNGGAKKSPEQPEASAPGIRPISISEAMQSYGTIYGDVKECLLHSFALLSDPAEAGIRKFTAKVLLNPDNTMSLISFDMVTGEPSEQLLAHLNRHPDHPSAQAMLEEIRKVREDPDQFRNAIRAEVELWVNGHLITDRSPRPPDEPKLLVCELELSTIEGRAEDCIREITKRKEKERTRHTTVTTRIKGYLSGKPVEAPGEAAEEEKSAEIVHVRENEAHKLALGRQYILNSYTVSITEESKSTMKLVVTQKGREQPVFQREILKEDGEFFSFVDEDLKGLKGRLFKHEDKLMVKFRLHGRYILMPKPGELSFRSEHMQLAGTGIFASAAVISAYALDAATKVTLYIPASGNGWLDSITRTVNSWTEALMAGSATIPYTTLTWYTVGALAAVVLPKVGAGALRRWAAHRRAAKEYARLIGNDTDRNADNKAGDGNDTQVIHDDE